MAELQDTGFRMGTMTNSTDIPAALSIVVLGASGDLAQRKIYPALFFLYGQGLLPANFNIFGFSRENPMGIRLLGPVAGVFVLIGAVIFVFYPLNEKTLELEPVRLFKRKKAV